jgi:circadian clock protein KaiC
LAFNSSAVPAKRLTTGVASLDDVLGGGIPAGSLVFVTGLPGSGKTILSEQTFFANAERSSSALYLTTLSEPPIKVLKYARDFRYFRPQLLERSAHFADLGSALRAGGPAALFARLEELIRERRPEFLVLDSFKVLREHFDDTRTFRAFVSDLAVLLATWEVTAFLVGEYAFEDIHREPEFAIADGIIHLSGTEEPTKQKRFMNIIKMRGANAFLGHHSYEISAEGVTVYPRMLPHVSGDYEVSDERVGSVMAGLNEMMDGGLRRGTVALISGGTGAGKTITALGFLVDGVRNGEHCLLATFEEGSNEIIANCGGLGWDLTGATDEGLLDVLHVSPSELDVDRHAIAIKDRAEQIGARRVVIDSITAFGASVKDQERVGAYLWGLADHFKRRGIILLLTYEASPIPDANLLSRNVSYVADAVIELSIAAGDVGDVVRCIRIVKIRGSRHDLHTRGFAIGAGGVRVLPETERRSP